MLINDNDEGGRRGEAELQQSQTGRGGSWGNGGRVCDGVLLLSVYGDAFISTGGVQSSDGTLPENMEEEEAGEAFEEEEERGGFMEVDEE